MLKAVVCSDGMMSFRPSAAHLLGEDRLDDLGVRVRHRVDVGDDGDLGGHDAGACERLLQLLGRRGHVAGVEGAGDGEAHCHAGLEVGLGDGLQGLAGLRAEGSRWNAAERGGKESGV